MPWQAHDVLREKDLEAAYINFLKAITIVVELIPQHRDMKAIESREAVELADRYWIVRKVSRAYLQSLC
jgi:USP8 dimerisation domain